MPSLNEEDGAQLIITNPKEGDVIVKCEDGNYRVEPQDVPAAGPWIRVDSGERPGDFEEVLVHFKNFSNDFQLDTMVTRLMVFEEDTGEVFDPEDSLALDDCECWARIRPPEER